MVRSSLFVFCSVMIFLRRRASGSMSRMFPGTIWGSSPPPRNTGVLAQLGNHNNLPDTTTWRQTSSDSSPPITHASWALLRHSPLPLLQTLHSIPTPTLARDFHTLLSSELASHILSFLPLSALACATRVSKSWHSVIDASPLVWTSLLKSSDMHWDSEATFLRVHRHLCYPHKSLFQSRYLTRKRWFSPKSPTSPTHRSFPCVDARRGGRHPRLRLH
ncbi:hypothetical protein C8R44DRAFT_822742 [Mycena epipterygia]|nr:hypothetical protein C8R44DRAFT_822742 [Mycena epipterygia]